MLKFSTVTHLKVWHVFRRSATPPSQEAGPNTPELLDSYLYAHSGTNSNQILHKLVDGKIFTGSITPPTLASFFATAMLTHDLFAVANANHLVLHFISRICSEKTDKAYER